MTYRELLNLYKNGTLDETQSEKVKNDIERQEAISEYLFDEDSLFTPEMTEDIEITDNNEAENSEKAFVSMINKSIRKAFIKMGVIVGIILLTIVMLITFVLPKGINMLYYNPAAITGERDGIETNQMSLDISVYTELFKPEHYRSRVDVDEDGYGCYDITIHQNSSYNGVFNNISGKIERGDLTLYDSTLLNSLSINAFIPHEIGVQSTFGGVGAAGEVEYAREALKNLRAGDLYIAYVTLSEVKSYAELVKWGEKNDIYPTWCTVSPKGDEGFYCTDNIGFMPSTSCTELAYDNVKYPYLSQFDMTLDSDVDDLFYSEDMMTTHFTSMLKYMIEQKDFCKMMELDIEQYDFKKIIEDTEKNGLYTYGFAIVADKDEILKIAENSDVYYIYTKLYQN